MMSRRPAAAFTLFEILISIVIFIMLIGGIFTTVQAAFTSSAEVASAQLDSEREEAFQQLLRRFFQSLPGDAKVELRQRREARGDVIELLAWPVDPFLRFGTDVKDGVALSALPDGRGRFRFSLAFFDAQDPPETRDQKLARTRWLPLLGDVTEVKWRLAPARNPVFSDVWTAASGRPGLVELTFAQLNGAGGTFAYWVPPLQRRSAVAAGPDNDGPPPPPPGESPAPPPGPPATP